MAYRDFKDLSRRRASDKVLPDKTFEIASNLNYDGYHVGLHQRSTTFLIQRLEILVLIEEQEYL